MNDYEFPNGWNDKGMDWESPQAECADYLVALREAVLERANVAGLRLVPAYGSSEATRGDFRAPFHFIRGPYFVEMEAQLRQLCGLFVDMEKLAEGEVTALDYDRLQEDEGLRTCVVPQSGSIPSAYSDWMANAKRLLDRMRVVQVQVRPWRTFGGDNLGDDYTMSPATAWADAKADAEENSSLYWNRAKRDFFMRTGMFRIIKRGDDFGGPYCSVSLSQYANIVFTNPYPLAARLLLLCERYYDEDEELDVFDGFGTGWTEGLNALGVCPAGPHTFTIDDRTGVADPDGFPNLPVPETYYGDMATRSQYCRLFADYAVAGGFRYFNA